MSVDTFSSIPRKVYLYFQTVNSQPLLESCRMDSMLVVWRSGDGVGTLSHTALEQGSEMIGLNHQWSFGQGKDCQPAFSFEFTILEASQENIVYIGSNAIKVKALGNKLGLMMEEHLCKTWLGACLGLCLRSRTFKLKKRLLTKASCFDYFQRKNVKEILFEFFTKHISFCLRQLFKY